MITTEMLIVVLAAVGLGMLVGRWVFTVRAETAKLEAALQALQQAGTSQQIGEIRQRLERMENDVRAVHQSLITYSRDTEKQLALLDLKIDQIQNEGRKP